MGGRGSLAGTAGSDKAGPKWLQQRLREITSQQGPAEVPTAKIEKGLGTERARLGRGWLVATRLGRTVAKAKIERGLGAKSARLGTFRGFGTERARLGAFRGFGTFYYENSFQNQNPPMKSTLLIFEKNFQLHQNFKPIRNFFFHFFTHIAI